MAPLIIKSTGPIMTCRIQKCCCCVDSKYWFWFWFWFTSNWIWIDFMSLNQQPRYLHALSLHGVSYLTFILTRGHRRYSGLPLLFVTSWLSEWSSLLLTEMETMNIYIYIIFDWLLLQSWSTLLLFVCKQATLRSFSRKGPILDLLTSINVLLIRWKK